MPQHIEIDRDDFGEPHQNHRDRCGGLITCEHRFAAKKWSERAFVTLLAASHTSVPNPNFASLCSAFPCELRIREDTGNSMNLVWFGFRSSLEGTRRDNEANF